MVRPSHEESSSWQTPLVSPPHEELNDKPWKAPTTLQETLVRPSHKEVIYKDNTETEEPVGVQPAQEYREHTTLEEVEPDQEDLLTVRDNYPTLEPDED